MCRSCPCAQCCECVTQTSQLWLFLGIYAVLLVTWWRLVSYAGFTLCKSLCLLYVVVSDFQRLTVDNIALVIFVHDSNWFLLVCFWSATADRSECMLHFIRVLVSPCAFDSSVNCALSWNHWVHYTVFFFYSRLVDNFSTRALNFFFGIGPWLHALFIVNVEWNWGV